MNQHSEVTEIARYEENQDTEPVGKANILPKPGFFFFKCRAFVVLVLSLFFFRYGGGGGDGGGGGLKPKKIQKNLQKRPRKQRKWTSP